MLPFKNQSVRQKEIFQLIMPPFPIYSMKQDRWILHTSIIQNYAPIEVERQQEKLSEIADEQYYNSQQHIAYNEQRITALKEKLQNAESKKNELEKDLQETEKYLLEWRTYR